MHPVYPRVHAKTNFTFTTLMPRGRLYMMRIEEDIKLDYSDVLLRPKRSTLTSRKEVELERNFKFYHSPKKWRGVPIMTANMATCGTFEMATVLAPHKMLTTFHKYYDVDAYKTFFKTLMTLTTLHTRWAHEVKILKN